MTPPADGHQSRFVGLIYDRPPDGFEMATGVLLDSIDDIAYSLTLMKAQGGDLLWLNREVGREAGRARWEVIGVLPVPAYSRDEQLVVGLCRRNGHRDSELSAVVVTNDAEWYRQVRQVWRANRKAGRFEAVPTAGVECENEGYGLG